MLSPNEFTALAAAPIPEIFLSSTTLLLASVAALSAVAFDRGQLCTARHTERALPAPSLFATLDSSLPEPKLTVTATRVGEGWQLAFETENWVFTDICGRGTIPVAEGHAHIYVGDTKIGIAHWPVFYIDDLPDSGPHLITASLRSADHRVIVFDRKVISAEVMLHPSADAGQETPAM